MAVGKNKKRLSVNIDKEIHATMMEIIEIIDESKNVARFVECAIANLCLTFIEPIKQKDKEAFEEDMKGENENA